MKNTTPSDNAQAPAKKPSDGAARPYGVQLFVDLERGRGLGTLVFRHREMRRPRMLRFIQNVVDAVTAADFPTRDKITIELTDKHRGDLSQQGQVFGCHVSVPVDLPADQGTDLVAWIRERYGSLGENPEGAGTPAERPDTDAGEREK